MSLLFMEGFDAYSATVNEVIFPIFLMRKWGLAGGTTQTIQHGRTAGGFSLVLGSYDYLQTPTFTGNTTWITGFGFQLVGTADNVPVVQLGDGPFFGIGLYHVSGVLKVIAGGIDYGVVLATGSSLASDTWYHIEVKLHISPTVGSFEVRINGVTNISLTNQNFGSTPISKITYASVHVSGPSVKIMFDDIFVCDGSGSTNNNFLGDMVVETISPQAPGSNTTWLPTGAADNYACVDDMSGPTSAVNDNTNWVSTSVRDNIDTYNFQNLTRITGNIKGVQTNIIYKSQGVNQVAPAILTGGNTYTGLVQGGDPFINTKYLDAVQIFEPNPDTSAAWTVDGINDAEFGISKY